MSSLRAVVPDDLQVIVCLTFDHHAPAAEVARFKDCLLECGHVLHAVEATGAFDFMVEARVVSLAEYNERLGALRVAVGHLIARYEANFVCRRFVRHHRRHQAIWVPCQDGKVRIDHQLIDKVVAEGDYMRLYCAGSSHLVHMTMHALSEMLGEDFVLLRRSVLIRCDFLDRLLHRDRKWIAKLRDGSHVAIAKSHIVEVMDKLHIGSAKFEACSSKDEAVVEKSISASSKGTSEDEQREIVMSSPTT